jgi:hypothetical protein
MTLGLRPRIRNTHKLCVLAVLDLLESNSARVGSFVELSTCGDSRFLGGVNDVRCDCLGCDVMKSGREGERFVQIDGWVDGWMDGWMNVGECGWMDEWVDEGIDGCLGLDGWLDGWTDGCGWMGERRNEGMEG